jgi:Rad3-related DNA helicase
MINPKLGLPAKYTEWRHHQLAALKELDKSKKAVFLLDAPTGVGKSLLAIAQHRQLQEDCVYITRTKQLQDQVMRDFGDIAKTIKGRGNYPCSKYYDKFPEVTAEDCINPKGCQFKKYCEYYVAKEKAINSPLAVLNGAYFLAEANRAGDFAGRPFMVVDEVDSFDADLMNYVQFSITDRQMQNYNLQLPVDPLKSESWLERMPAYIDILSERASEMQSQLGLLNRMVDTDFKQYRLSKKLLLMADKLSLVENDFNPGTWLFYVENKPDGGAEFVFKPINIGPYANFFGWRHTSHILGMSGTILDPGIVAQEIGLSGKFDYYQLESPFPVKNRPIYYKPVVDLRYEQMVTELPKLAEEVDLIVNRYPNGKVLIHTVSYAVREFLWRHLRCQERLVTHESANRTEMLEEFKKSPSPLVMLSPSFDRGVDLPNDECRCIIICKMPFLSLGDPLVQRKKSLPGGQKWYQLKTLQTLMQMCGRGIRNEKDFCDTFILDKQFERLRFTTRFITPVWWSSSIKKVTIS